MGRRHWFCVGALIPLIAVLVGGLAFRWWQTTDHIALGVHINGVPVGGQTVEQARTIVTQLAKSAKTSSVSITLQDSSVQVITLSQLCAVDVDATLQDALTVGRRESFVKSVAEILSTLWDEYEVSLHFRLDEKKATNLLQQLAQKLNQPPKQASVELDGETVHILPSQDGVQLKIDETLQCWRLRIATGQWQTLPLIMRTWKAKVTTDDVAVIDGIVNQVTTAFKTSHRNRTHNINLAAKSLDHVLIRPGETISFNELVGPRTRKRGFLKARVLLRKGFTQDFGGGVCQVAGTLYNAALGAGMTIVERNRHSRPIEYLPSGLDATVDFGKLDLKLRNPFPTPLYLLTFVKGGRLTIVVLGKKSDIEYRVVRYVQRFGIVGTKEVVDTSLQTGRRKVADKGNVGYRVVVWRLWLENGVIKHRELVSTDIYPPKPRIVRLGATLAFRNPQSKRLAPDGAATPSPIDETELPPLNNETPSPSPTNETPPPLTTDAPDRR